MAHLAEREGHVVLQGAGVGHVGIHALLEAELLVAAHVVALPVAGAGGTLAPILLVVGAADVDLVGGALVKAGKVAAQHDEIGAHGQSERDVVVVDDAAVGADGDVNAGFFKVAVALGADVDHGGGLPAADALGLPRDADGAAADADLDEVRAALGEEAEARSVHDVARADLHAVAVLFADPGEGEALPVGVALGGVDAQHVRAGLQQGGHALFIVAGVDAGADHVALVRVEQLVGILLVALVVLAEDEIAELARFVDDGQGIELVIPDDIVGLFERGALLGPDQLVKGSHERGDGRIRVHAGDTIVAAGDDADELALGCPVFRDGDGGVPGLLLEAEHVAQGLFGADIGVGADKARLVALGAPDHGGLVLDGLGAVNEAHAALLSQRHGQSVAGDGLHDRRDHGDVHHDGGLLALAVFYQRGFERYLLGAASDGRVARDEKVLIKSMAGFVDDLGHDISPLWLFDSRLHAAIKLPEQL